MQCLARPCPWSNAEQKCRICTSGTIFEDSWAESWLNANSSLFHLEKLPNRLELCVQVEVGVSHTKITQLLNLLRQGAMITRLPVRTKGLHPGRYPDTGLTGPGCSPGGGGSRFRLRFSLCSTLIPIFCVHDYANSVFRLS